MATSGPNNTPSTPSDYDPPPPLPLNIYEQRRLNDNQRWNQEEPSGWRAFDNRLTRQLAYHSKSGARFSLRPLMTHSLRDPYAPEGIEHGILPHPLTPLSPRITTEPSLYSGELTYSRSLVKTRQYHINSDRVGIAHVATHWCRVGNASFGGSVGVLPLALAARCAKFTLGGAPSFIGGDLISMENIDPDLAARTERYDRQSAVLTIACSKFVCSHLHIPM